MNLSILEEKVKSGDLSKATLLYLINCRMECEMLDYKIELNLETENQLCGVVKDLIAMKNIGGGFIVIGVEDKTYQPKGLTKPLIYDSKMLRDKIRKATGGELDVDLVQHDLELVGGNALFALIYVRSTRKQSKLKRKPFVVQADFHPDKPFGLRKGDIFFRDGDSTKRVTTSDQLMDMLDNFRQQVDQDALLERTSQSPFAIDDGLYRLLDKGFERFIGRESLKNTLVENITRDPRIWIINVHGPGGVGKTALVNWAAHHFYQKRSFEAIIQLTAKDSILDETGIKRYAGRSLYSLEDLLQHILTTFKEEIPNDIQEQKRLATEVLSAWSTLLILDNMETVHDGRILNFVQDLPPGTKAKVLLTSRHKTGGWELAVPVNELTENEVGEYLRVKVAELGVEFPIDETTVRKVTDATGGLPLAIQWVLARFKLSNDVTSVVSQVNDRDSPVLEFSFRNIWDRLPIDARTILAVLTIFDGAQPVQPVAIAVSWSLERVETALNELADVTLVNRFTNSNDGRVLYSALPITLEFAKAELSKMGDLELECRKRWQHYSEQMRLDPVQTEQLRGISQKYGLTTENEKRAAILCVRAYSDCNAGLIENADLLYKQARDLAPTCAYIFIQSAKHDLRLKRIGRAIEYAEEAIKRAQRKTASSAYKVMSDIYEAEKNLMQQVYYLSKAVEADPLDYRLRHQYGVALSKAKREEDAIAEFSKIIDDLQDRPDMLDTVVVALNTREKNYRRIGKSQLADADANWIQRLKDENPALAKFTSVKRS